MNPREKNTNVPDRPERIARKAKKMADHCRDRQKFHGEKAQQFGYAKDGLNFIHAKFQSVPDNPIYAGFENQLDKLEVLIDTEDAYIELPIITAATSATATTSIGELAIGEIATSELVKTDSVEIVPYPSTNWTEQIVEECAQRLKWLEPELSSLQRSVWQTFYSGVENAERSALSVMRQLYDHFFEIIAPDEKVRASEYFKPKKENNPNQIFRRERIRYAANESVNNRKLGMLLEAEADNLLDLYDELNRLHKRGPLPRQSVLKTLESAQAQMKQWLDAVC